MSSPVDPLDVLSDPSKPHRVRLALGIAALADGLYSAGLADGLPEREAGELVAFTLVVTARALLDNKLLPICARDVLRVVCLAALADELPDILDPDEQN